MPTIEELRTAGGMPDARMDFELAILADASVQADRYWSNWLWGRPQEAFEPDPALVAELACDRTCEDVRRTWRAWFGTLTDPAFADAIIGADVAALLATFEAPERT